MKYFEFGTEHPELMIMLHGGGVSYRGALPAAEYMAQFYHVVLVSYDGFNPTEPETTFQSVDYKASTITRRQQGVQAINSLASIGRNS